MLVGFSFSWTECLGALMLRRALVPLAFCLLLAGLLSPSEAALPKIVVRTLAQAANDVSRGTSTLTDGQKSLLVWYNDDINRARMNGLIRDEWYQAGQNVHHSVSSGEAGKAARQVGAKFTVQQSTRQTFMPGTDSDYIYELDRNSANPVDDVRRIQQGYNDGLNDFMRRSIDADPKVKAALEAEGIRFEPRSDWHRKLDVDFMADPKTVTQSQFEEIGKLNNDAYKRREAAEFERISRAKDGTQVTPEMYTKYTDEMRDFIKKKRATLAKIRKNPSLLNNPDVLADYHRIMAQEQKYIARIEGVNAHLRGQEKLGVAVRPQASSTYVIHYDEQGRAVLTQRSDATLAKQASSRSPGNMATSMAGNNLGIQSENRALVELSESMAEAARRNPSKWATAPEDIARLTEHLTPAEKGRLIESIKRNVGRDMARQVAESMRKQASTVGDVRAAGGGGIRASMSQLDDALRGALGVSDDLSRMGGFRRGFNEAAAKALGGLENLSKGAVGVEVVMAASSMRTFIANIQKGMDPSIPDDEAEECFQRAMEAGKAMLAQGSLGTLFEAVPTTGVVFLGWTIGYDGTSYILTNTKTGEEFNRRATDYFDSHKKASEEAWADINEFVGNQSERSRAADQIADLESSLINAIREGRVVLKPGVSVQDVVEMIRNGDILGARELIEQVGSGNSTVVLDHLQNELLALYQLAGKIKADYEILQTESQTARAQMTIANGHLANVEDIQKKLFDVDTDCRRVAELQTQIQEDSSGAVKLEDVVRRNCDAIDTRAANVRSEAELKRLRDGYEAAAQAAGKVGAAARHAKSQNDELRKIVQAAQKAVDEYGRALVLIDKGRDATQAGISSCLRIDDIAPRHEERTAELNQRRAALFGQIERMQQAYANLPEAVARLGGIQQGVGGVNPGPPSAGLLVKAKASREGLDLIRERLAALRGQLVDPQPCGEQKTEDDAVTAADQAAHLAALRVAQTKLVLDGAQIANAKPVDIHDLTVGIDDRPPAVDISDLTVGVDDRLPMEEEGADPGELVGGSDEHDPDSQDAEKPVAREPVRLAEEEKPLFAVYAVHPYPPVPRDLRQIPAWRERVLNVRTFQPEAKATGYIAFRVTGQTLQEYRQHQRKVEAGETDEPFTLFRPKACYHQSYEGSVAPGVRGGFPLFLRFFRFEQKEPTWVRETKIGLLANAGMAGSIQTLADSQTRGSWIAELEGQTHYDWSAAL